MKTKNRGSTLIELLIATLIFSVALGALLSSLVAIVNVIDLSRERTIATADLRNMLERIRSAPFSSLLTNFPNGLADGPVSNPYVNITGGYQLIDEHITVNYANPNVDPLEIQVVETWKNKKGHAYNAALSTFKTRSQ